MKKILFLIVALAATLNMSAQGPTVSLGTAKPVVYAGEDTNWRSELMSLLAEVKGYINMLDPGEAKTKLQEAYDVALAVFAGGGDYEKAYNDLWTVFQEVLINQLIDLVGALETEITNAETALASIAYEDKYNELDTEITKAKVIRDDFYYNKTEFAIKDIAFYKDAKTTLANKVTTITASDYAQAHNALATSITHATADILPTLSLSNLIKTALSTAIATAQGVLDASEPASTAKELKQADDDLNAEVSIQVEHYVAFVTAKDELNTKIGEANTLFTGISTDYAGIRNALDASIVAATTVYDGAADKTTEELTTATGNIVAAIDAAEAAKEEAGKISVWITNANATLPFLSLPNREIVNNAIAAAEDALATESTAENLQIALNELIDKTKTFIGEDVADACEGLTLAITNANYIKSHTLAYDSFKTLLGEAVSVAQGVLDDPNHTAAGIRTAAETLNTAATNIATDDANQALTDLTNAINDATTLVTTLDSKNHSIAGDLQAVLTDASLYVSTGTGVQRQRKAAELTEAIEIAKSEEGIFDTNVTAFSNEINRINLNYVIADADPLVVVDDVELKETHTGIKTALLSAKSAAETVYTVRIDKTNLQLGEAISALQGAIAEAKTAEVKANNLEDLIETATTAKDSIIVDDADKLALGGAIEVANALFADPAKKSTDYEAACTDLKDQMDKYIKSDIGKAITLLTIEKNKARDAKEIVAYQATRELIQGAIDLAVVPEDAGRSVIDGLRVALETSVATIVAEDLADVKIELQGAKDNAEIEIAPYRDIANNINTTFDDGAAKSNYENVVINTLDGKIYEAGEYLAVGSEANGRMMKEKAGEIAGAIVDMKDANTTLRAGEIDNFTNVLFAEQDLANGVKAENNVIVGNHHTAMDAGLAIVDEIFGLHPETCTYDRIINARIDMEKEFEELSTEFDLWKDYRDKLVAKIAEAYNVKAGLEEVEGTIGNALQKAISTAETALGDKMNRRAEVNISTKKKSMKAEYDALVKAINTANSSYSKQYWDFADDATVFKKNTTGYAVEHARYTRSNEFIKEDKYGTFCMPMDIMVDYEADGAQFKHVYVPEDFAILNPETNILKLFLTEKKQGDVISAGTPFFAQLACEGELVLKNSTPLVVLSTSPSDIPTVDKDIRIYNQSANSSFVTKNEDIKYVWNGTFKKMTGTDITSMWVSQEDGSFAKATQTDGINPFRAYLEQKVLNVNAKSIEAIEFDFGDGSETTGIRSIMMGSADGSQIFSIDGKKMGNDMNSLNKGVYIINGKKVLK